MKLKPALATAAIALSLLGTTACGQRLDPCRNVSVDNQEALAQFASDNPQIEIEATGEDEAECILTGGGDWVNEADFDDEGEDD